MVRCFNNWCVILADLVMNAGSHNIWSVLVYDFDEIVLIMNYFKTVFIHLKQKKKKIRRGCVSRRSGIYLLKASGNQFIKDAFVTCHQKEIKCLWFIRSHWLNQLQYTVKHESQMDFLASCSCNNALVN